MKSIIDKVLTVAKLPGFVETVFFYFLPCTIKSRFICLFQTPYAQSNVSVCVLLLKIHPDISTIYENMDVMCCMCQHIYVFSPPNCSSTYQGRKNHGTCKSQNIDPVSNEKNTWLLRVYMGMTSYPANIRIFINHYKGPVFKT